MLLINGRDTFFHILKFLSYNQDSHKIRYLNRSYSLFEKDELQKYSYIIHPHGLSRGYFPGEILKSKVMYINGVRHGLFTDFYENGKIRSEYKYENGKIHGSYKVWNETGILIEEHNYYNDLENGFQKTFFLNGQVESEIMYIEGKQNGEYKLYYKNGRLSECCNISTENRYKIVKKKYLDDEKNTLFSLENYLNKSYEGPQKVWYDNGLLKSVINYKEDQKDGLTTIWNNNGLLMTVENYYQDHLRGIVKYCYGKVIPADEEYNLRSYDHISRRYLRWYKIIIDKKPRIYNYETQEKYVRKIWNDNGNLSFFEMELKSILYKPACSIKREWNIDGILINEKIFNKPNNYIEKYSDNFYNIEYNMKYDASEFNEFEN
jgi:antitoxin component YwqK of YwqJK toxin-antitoxin module